MKTIRWLLVVGLAAALAACGGGLLGNQGRIRLVNAATGLGALDLFIDNEAAAVGVSDERMVKVGRLRKAEQLLEHALDRGRGSEVGAADDRRDAARRIVDHAGEVIGRGRVLAGQDRVADLRRVAGEDGPIRFPPAGQARRRHRLGRRPAPDRAAALAGLRRR